jgi:energy-coupling factor transport system ATP-binding protein
MERLRRESPGRESRWRQIIFLKGNTLSGAIIQLDNVSWAYSRARDWALKNISVKIGEGEFIAVMGENGAGKTSFCRLLNGLIPHSLPGKLIGSVTVDGIETASCSVAQIAKIAGTVFEDPWTQLFTARVEDETAFALENLLVPPDEIKERVRWALDATGLTAYADRAPATLSGGQKQRLALAAALAMAEKMLVLDEPASQLDPEGTGELHDLIRKLRELKKLTVVMATNSAEEARLADKICFLKNGCVIAFGTPQSVFEKEEFRNNFPNTDPPSVEPSCPQHSEDANAIIEISGLHYEYISGNVILDDINLSFMENDFSAVTGPNGCGKTTLLRNISGLLRPQRGRILLRGQDTAKMGITRMAGEIGFVMQECDRQLFESTVYDEVAFALKRTPHGRRLGKNEIRDKTEESLSLMEMLDQRDAFPPALGRADRVKTVFAAILAMGPRIIMLDEPIAGQDARGCHLIMETLANLHQRGYTIIMVTHNKKVITKYAHRIIEMQ